MTKFLQGEESDWIILFLMCHMKTETSTQGKEQKEEFFSTVLSCTQISRIIECMWKLSCKEENW